MAFPTPIGAAQATLFRWAVEVDWLASAPRPLHRLPITFRDDIRWWRRTVRTAAGEEHHSTWAVRELTVPAGTVAVLATASGDRLRWSRAAKGWQTEWDFQSRYLEAEWGGESLARRPRHPWWCNDPWTRRIDAPADADLRWLLPPPAECTAGRVLPLCATQNGTELAAALFVAKDDTHFRRVGLWGLRPECAAAVPQDMLPLLLRGRAGELRSTP